MLTIRHGLSERIIPFAASQLEGLGSKALTMPDNDHTAAVVFRLIVMQKIAHDLKGFFETEPQLPSRLQTLLRKLDEQQKQNR